jgi:hypothetical protein
LFISIASLLDQGSKTAGRYKETFPKACRPTLPRDSVLRHCHSIFHGRKFDLQIVVSEY